MFKKIIVIFLCCLPRISNAQATFQAVTNPQEVLAAIQQVASETKTIKAAYSGETHLAVMENPELTQGIFYYANTGQMRWEQQKPVSYIILMNDGAVRVQDQGKELKMGGNASRLTRINEFMMSLVQGDYTQNNNFEVSCFESNKQHKIHLVPLNRMLAKYYLSIELYFAKANNQLDRIVFNQPDGDKMIMNYEQQQYNQAIDTKLFTNF